MIKCVVFDFDGTLVKSNEIKRRVFYEVTEDIVGAGPVLDELFSVPDSGDRYNIFDALIKNLKLGQEVGISAVYLSDLYTKICEHKISEAPEAFGAFNTLTELKKINALKKSSFFNIKISLLDVSKLYLMTLQQLKIEKKMILRRKSQ